MLAFVTQVLGAKPITKSAQSFNNCEAKAKARSGLILCQFARHKVLCSGVACAARDFGATSRCAALKVLWRSIRRAAAKRPHNATEKQKQRHRERRRCFVAKYFVSRFGCGLKDALRFDLRHAKYFASDSSRGT
jgi:hypothetical protein